MTKTKTMGKKSRGFSDFEKEAMKERAQEMVVGEGRGEEAVLAKIAEMQEPDRSVAKRIHEIVKKNAPNLMPKTWYGMPAYANKDGKAVCFFQAAAKFKARYATFGFNDPANLDEGTMWPTSFAITKLTDKDEAKISALVAKAAR